MADTEILEQRKAFQDAPPETILELAETGLDTYCTGLCRPMNSYINRVYELEDEDGEGIIVKLYRPGRWSAQALQDEHDFLLELQSAEIPVIAPLRHTDGKTLGHWQGGYFGLFPKCGGRSFDELNDEQWLAIGRLLGRTHAIGAAGTAGDRITLHPEHATRSHLEYLLASGLIPGDLVANFQSAVTAFTEQTAPLFTKTSLHRIHGDCHFANLIHRPGDTTYIIDFDDMAVGPAVQDIWMLLPGPPQECLRELDLFLEGYKTFHSFDTNSLCLIEALRGMRFIHYTAWCAHQVLEDGQTLVVENFGTREYWQQETADLNDQLVRMMDMPDLAAYF